jgi:16S rRNA (cytidine1402-2'-O)-methyltransferase
VIESCPVFFVENERTTRRYFRDLWKKFRPGEIFPIDRHEWVTINEKAAGIFKQRLNQGMNAAIISDAGCPGIADPGQQLVAIAQEMHIPVKPMAGPSSILLALMASGMNGQQFRFNGYLPIKKEQRINAIRELETESGKKKCTEIFIETPYRNISLMQDLVRTCKAQTRLCVAADLTSKHEWIITKTIAEWRKDPPAIGKQVAIFLLDASTHL